jgi:hypothetical protein
MSSKTVKTVQGKLIKDDSKENCRERESEVILAIFILESRRVIAMADIIEKLRAHAGVATLFLGYKTPNTLFLARIEPGFQRRNLLRQVGKQRLTGQ